MPPPPESSRQPSRRASARRALGAAAERVASAYLSARGYTIIERNRRRRWGEADIIAEATDGSLVVVEVRARSNARYAVEAAYSVGPRKQERLRRLARELSAELADDTSLRVDVMIVAPDRRGQLTVITHIEGAVEDSESNGEIDL